MFKSRRGRPFFPRMDLTHKEPQPRVRFILFALIGGITALRLFSAGTVGLGDVEAYYWTWSRDLSLSYFDHGPIVALLIRAGTTLLGDGEGAHRAVRPAGAPLQSLPLPEFWWTGHQPVAA